MRNTIKKLACFVLLLCAFTTSALSNEEKVYRVGLEDVDYYPMFTKIDERSKTSFLVDVMELFAERNGLKFEYIHLPVTRFDEWYQQDDIDFRIPDSPIWSVKTDNLVFSQGIIKLRADTVVLKQDESKPLSSLKVLGSLYGFVPGPHWRDHISAGRTKFIYESSMSVLVRMLKKGMIDGLDVSIFVVHHYAKHLGYKPEDFVASSQAPSTHFSYQLSTMSYPEIIKDFDAFLVASQNEISMLKQRKNIFDVK